MDGIDPYEEDELHLVNDFLVRLTELYPEWPLVDRADLALEMFYVVGRWAKEHGGTKEKYGHNLDALKKNQGESTYSVDMTDPLR